MGLAKWLKERVARLPVPTPLYDFVLRCKPEGAKLHLESSQDGEAHRLSTTVVMLSLSLSRDFLKSHVLKIEELSGPFSRDVLAFETVTFFHYALRAYYEQSTYDDYADDRYEEYFDTFQNSTALTRQLMQSRSATNMDEAFIHRYNTYIKTRSIDGKSGAAEHFRFMLQTIRGAIAPLEMYGPPSLDLSKSLQMIAIVQSFTASFVPAYCKAFSDLIEEYGLEPD